MAKSPAFQFYPDSWLSSLSITLMTPAEEGAYIRLLCHAWLSPDCSLPADSESLQTLSRLGVGWKKSEAKLRAKFRQDGERLFNDRLLLERTKQEVWREKSSKGGRKSGAARLQPESKGGSLLVDDCLQPKGNSSSPSSSPSPVNTLQTTTTPLFPADAANVAAEKRLKKMGWLGPKKTPDEVCQEIARARWPENSDPKSPAMIAETLCGFECFWMAYFRHEAKADARLAYFDRVGIDENLLAVICSAVEAQTPTMMAKPQDKRPLPATWLRGERWLDKVGSDE